MNTLRHIARPHEEARRRAAEYLDRRQRRHAFGLQPKRTRAQAALLFLRRLIHF